MRGLRRVLVRLTAASLELKEEREDRTGAEQVMGYGPLYSTCRIYNLIERQTQNSAALRKILSFHPVCLWLLK